jgi:hypothetical protein
MLNFARAAKKDIITTGMHEARGHGGGRHWDWQGMTWLEDAYLFVGLPPAKLSIPRLARTAIFSYLESGDTQYGLGLEEALNFETEFLVIDSSLKNPLIANTQLHVPIEWGDRANDVSNYVYEMTGGYPARYADEFAALDWRDASLTELQETDTRLAKVVQLAIDSSYSPASGGEYYTYAR